MASINLSDDSLAQLKALIGQFSKNPSILNRSELGFFKSFIEQLGGSIPKDTPKFQPKANENGESKRAESPPPDLEEQEPESEESDLEFDMTGVIGNSKFFQIAKYLFWKQFEYQNICFHW